MRQSLEAEGKDPDKAGKFNYSQYDHPPTTWKDLGIDPNHPMAAMMYDANVAKARQGFDMDAALIKAGDKQGVLNVRK